MCAAAAPLPRPIHDDPEPAAARRPRLLLDAARFGVVDYRRNRDLPRLLGMHWSKGDVMARLSELEEKMEAARLADDPQWCCQRHVEVLIALLAERAYRK